MFDWLQSPHSDYVLVAYGITVLGLFGLVVVSWHFARKQRTELARVAERERANGE